MEGKSPNTRLLTVKQVAAMTASSRATIYRAINDGHLKASTVGRSRGFRIRGESVEEWIDSMLFEPEEQPSAPSESAYAERAKRQQPRRGFLSP